MSTIDELFTKVGFERKETDTGYAYLLDLNTEPDCSAERIDNDGLLVTQQSERYVMVTDMDGLTVPSKIEQPIKVVLFEFIGETAYERWAGIYTTADKFLSHMQAGYPWITKPQCHTDGCRRFVDKGQVFCPECKSKLN